MSRRPRSAKRAMLNLIELMYRHGYGPKHCALVLQLHPQTVNAHARALGIRVGTTRPNPPREPPYEVLVAVTNYHFALRKQAPPITSAIPVAELRSNCDILGGAVPPTRVESNEMAKKKPGKGGTKPPKGC